MLAFAVLVAAPSAYAALTAFPEELVKRKLECQRATVAEDLMNSRPPQNQGSADFGIEFFGPDCGTKNACSSRGIEAARLISFLETEDAEHLSKCALARREQECCAFLTFEVREETNNRSAFGSPSAAP